MRLTESAPTNYRLRGREYRRQRAGDKPDWGTVLRTGRGGEASAPKTNGSRVRRLHTVRAGGEADEGLSWHCAGRAGLSLTTCQMKNEDLCR